MCRRSVHVIQKIKMRKESESMSIFILESSEVDLHLCEKMKRDNVGQKKMRDQQVFYNQSR